MLKHLFSVPTGSALQFSAANSAQAYRKDAVRAGRYYVPHMRMYVDIPPDRLDHWATTFSAFKEAGNSVYFTVDHKSGVEARRGEVVGMNVEGDRLMFDVVPASEEARKLIESNPQVSIEADPVFTGSNGQRFEDVITAISAVRHPVVTDQQPFVPLAASVSGGETAQGVLLLYQGDSPDVNDDPGDQRPTENPMFTPEQLKQLRLSLNAGDDVKDDALATMVLERITKPAPAPEVAQLEEANKTILSLKGQVEELKKGTEPAVDTDVLEQQADLDQQQLSLLVERGNITQAVADEVGKVMLGQPGDRPKLMLSQKVAAAAGVSQRLNKTLLSVLGKLEMGVKSGQRSGQQTLNRPNPDGKNPNEPDEWVAKDLAAANAGK